VTSHEVASAVKAAAEALMRLGGATPGDKTMLEALLPFSDTLSSRVDAGDTLGDAWFAASRAARVGAEQSARLTPRVGRARPLAARSVGFPDPGAVSFALAISVAGETFGDDAEERRQWQSRLPFGSDTTDEPINR
jgi:dihydroxyacetone kinase